jgi:hypothetical protein
MERRSASALLFNWSNSRPTAVIEWLPEKAARYEMPGWRTRRAGVRAALAHRVPRAAQMVRAVRLAGTVEVPVVHLKIAAWQAQISLQSRTFSWRAAARHRCAEHLRDWRGVSRSSPIVAA